jgi:DNA polymerase I-like protein with 3'-5' exonuclease and polymerase domains
MSGRLFKLVPPPVYVGTDEQAQDLLHLSLRKLKEDPEDLFGFDTETTGKTLPVKVGVKRSLDWMSDIVVFWSLAFRYRGEPLRFCIPGEYLQYFSTLLENPQTWLACWNAKYDAHVSYNSGINIWNANVVDGVALAGLHDENKKQRGLKVCAKDWAGLSMTKYEDLFPNRDQFGRKIKEYETSLLELADQGFLDQVSDYASYDAYCHLETVEWVRDRLKATRIQEGYSLWDYYLNMEKDITEVLWRMERRGMFVDREYLKQQLPLIDQEILAIEKEINNAAGRPINIGSTQQLGAFFFGSKESGGLGLKLAKLTKGGKASVDKEVLGLLESSGHKIAQMIVRHRHISKVKSTYITTLVSLAEHYEDRRVHPNFNQFGASTGRFSTDAPNSQNMPRANNDEFGIRKAFTAPPGHKLIIADYEQLEMRVMGHMATDPSMIQAIREGKDLHSFTVSRMVPGVTYEEVVAAKKVKDKDALTDRQKKLLQARQDNKSIGFGIIYGAGPPRIAQAIEIPEADVQARIQRLTEEELAASSADIRRGKTLSGRMERAIKANPLLTPDKAIVLVARQSIAAEKIQAYFDTFPAVHDYMRRIPEECRQSMEWEEVTEGAAKPRSRPRDREGNPIADGLNYDWDMDYWIPGQSEPLTRTGHTKKFGFVKTLCGRLRRLEDINHSNYAFKSEAERQSVNSTIQGSAADITKGAMLRIERNSKLNFLKVQLLNQIHDELMLQVPEENAEEALPIIVECMEHPFAEGVEALIVPIPVEAKITDSWSEK